MTCHRWTMQEHAPHHISFLSVQENTWINQHWWRSMDPEINETKRPTFISDGELNLSFKQMQGLDLRSRREDRAGKKKASCLCRLLSNRLPPCGYHLASPRSHQFTRSAGDCRPRWFVNTDHLSITLPLISTSLIIAPPGCSVMCLTIQQDLFTCHSLICNTARPDPPTVISPKVKSSLWHERNFTHMQTYACILIYMLSRGEKGPRDVQ